MITLYFIVTLIRQQRRIFNLQQERILTEINTIKLKRKRIASKLHDGLGPLLSTIKLNINSLDTELEGDQLVIVKASKHLDDVMNNIRDISYNLMPVALCEALREFIEKTLSPFGIQVKFFFVEIPKVFTREKEIHIYRMMQEIVNNTMKHANAKKFLIKISIENNILLLQTEDDGKGFNQDEVDEMTKSLGIKNFYVRSSVLNAKMICKSALSKGTRYTFEIPKI